MSVGGGGTMWAFLRSRRGVALSAFLLLLGLDAARSTVGHFGYLSPVSVWRPDPGVYADMTWPPATNAPAGATPAQRLYVENCAFCHGPDGRGDGASATSMIPRPRDFTQGLFKYKSTPEGMAPSDEDLVAVVTNGLNASGMPFFRGVMSEQEIRDVVGVVKGFSKVFDAAKPAAMALGPRPRPTPESLARGADLYKANCALCHGDDLRGGKWLEDSKGYPVVSRDLTAPWTFRGGDAPEQVFLRLSIGLAPAPMPAFASLSEESRWDLVALLESRRRTPPWAPDGKLDGPGQSADLEARGRYLVHAEMCGLCHTEIDRTLVYRDDHYLAGGMRVGAYPQGVFISRNLTSDPDTGLGRWSEAEVAAAIRDGRSKDGRVLNLWGMPWPFFHNLTRDDAQAIARYLKTLPAVRNQIPPPLHYGVVETIAAKFWLGDPLLGQAPRLTYDVGSYANPGGLTAGAIEAGLAWAQGAVLVVAIILFFLASRRAGRRRRCGRAIGATVAGAVILALGYYVDATPALPILPPEQVSKGASGSVPRPDVSRAPPERAALVARGRYIFANASCALCHGNDGAGGLKVNGADFGTVFAANLSPDRETGLGAWSDAEIARAIRSGVSRDGRPLFWQGMPWDHFSNLDEEDVASVIAFLRMLPPVARKTPATRPAGPGDCPIYTFWTVPDQAPGCR